ncbi:MAG: thioredoxin domain-containing protein [Rubrivivax sp.]|nr:thioredoxin domain-containing protein [Rubrivivax sp.]
MSRKSKPNPPKATGPQLPLAPQAGATARRNLFIGALVALLVAFVAATLIYKKEKVQSSQLAAASHPPALTREQAPTFGNADAKVHIVEFFDPACETCAVFFPHVKKMLSANPDRIRLSVRHVPFHKGSDQVVRVLEAARKQAKYLPTLEALYASQPRWAVQHEARMDQVWEALGGLGLDLDRLRNDMQAPEISQRMAQDMEDARVLGVTKTPEFFVNGRPLPSFGLEQLKSLVNEELGRAYP